MLKSALQSQPLSSSSCPDIFQVLLKKRVVETMCGSAMGESVGQSDQHCPKVTGCRCGTP